VLERAQALLVICAALAAATACSSSGKTGASGDGGKDSGQSTCTLQEGGTSYDCGGGETWPACPANLQGTACAQGAPQCMGCNQGAGYYCTCQGPEADGGFVWTCPGTEYPCQ
jgi:hypothetical protein